jgi:hypothetical protein
MTQSLQDHDDPLRRFDWTTFESASQAVAAAVVDESGAQFDDIEPLYGAVDTDALDDLVQTGDATSRFVGGRVAFDYLGYRVELDSCGYGFLYALTGAPDRQPEVPQQSIPVNDG